MHFNLGLAQEHLGDHEAAAAEFRKDIAIEPDLPYSYEQLARLSVQEGKENQALEHFRAALARDTRQSQSHLEVARILIRQGQERRPSRTSTPRKDMRRKITMFAPCAQDNCLFA